MLTHDEARSYYLRSVGFALAVLVSFTLAFGSIVSVHVTIPLIFLLGINLALSYKEFYGVAHSCDLHAHLLQEHYRYPSSLLFTYLLTVLFVCIALLLSDAWSLTTGQYLFPPWNLFFVHLLLYFGVLEALDDYYFAQYLVSYARQPHGEAKYN